MQKLKLLDLFTGLAGFSLAADKTGMIETIMCAETDSYNAKLIDRNLGLDNAGDVSYFGISEDYHPQNPRFNAKYENTPAVEITGFSTVTAQDFYEGILDYPDIISGGFPCQNVSSAHLHCTEGIDGSKSKLVQDQLNIIEDLEPKYVIFENAERLNSKGLDRILHRLNELGYIVEFETISAAAFNYPHYRHRVFIVGYQTDSVIATSNARVFDSVRQIAQFNLEKPFKFPLTNENPQWIKRVAVVDDPKSIPLRTKRINSLGNAIIPDIAKAIFESILHHEPQKSTGLDFGHVDYEAIALTLHGESWVNKSNEIITKLPTRGYMKAGVIYSSGKCKLLNISKKLYSDLFPTLISRDGNNNFTCKSRLTRPGGLGGLTGKIMSIGVNKGALDPNFCELMMGYSENYTRLAPILTSCTDSKKRVA